jgi:hypothetical protein
MKLTATISVTTQITQEIEVDLPDEYDFNPSEWDQWENTLDEAGIRPTVLHSDVVHASTDVIQFTVSPRERSA